MAYDRVNWQNQPSTATPVNADNLNKMDKGINDLEEGKIPKSDIVQTDTINDPTKVPSTSVTHALGQEVAQLNNNLASKSKEINGDILAWALTCGRGITAFYATEPLSNIPSGVATYSIGYVLRGSASPTAPTRVLLFNRTSSDIYVNTFFDSSWVGWNQIGTTVV